MILLRSSLYFAGMVLVTIFFATLIVIIGWALPFKKASYIGNAWGASNLWLLSNLCNLNYEIKGLENVPENGCIILSKHQSTWETMALRALLPPNQVWVVKKELLWVPFFGWALMALNAIGIDRKSGRSAMTQVVKAGEKYLKQGHYVVIFPEGTRVAPGERIRYGAGGAILAHHSKFPIIPVALNSGVFWGRHGLKKYPGTIQVVVGAPIEVEGLKSSEINKKAEEWIESTMETLPKTLEG